VTTPSQSYSLGIVPAGGISWQIVSGTGSKQGEYKYAITFVTADGLESNPQDFDLTLSFVDISGAPMAGDMQLYDIPTSADPRVVARNIYRSMSNNAALYFLAQIPDNSTSYTSGSPWVDNFSDGELDLTRPLTWSDGGFPESGGIYVEDHSIPPTLSILSTGLHAANGAVGRSGSGIVFGAVGSTVYWSALGFPDYWPVVNQFSLAENVESIVAFGGATFVFTPNFVYQARGDSDSQITWNRTNAAFGVKRGMGRFTTPTTQGILFFAQDGLAVFDGSNARLVAENKLPRNYFDSLTISAVGYFRSRFHVFTTDATNPTIIFDFRDGIGNPVITTSSHVVTAAHVANYAEPVTADLLPELPSSVSSIRVAVGGSYLIRTSSTTYTVEIASTGIAAPTVAPSGARATASLLFSVDRIGIVTGGSGFTSAPRITFATPSGQGRPATGVATVAGGRLVSITITDPGAGYTLADLQSATLMSFSIGSPGNFDVYGTVTAVQVTNSGFGYASSPKVTVSVSNSAARKVGAQLFAELEPIRYVDAALVYVGNNLYRIGGDFIKSPNPSSTLTNTIDKYDSSAKSWSRISATTTSTFGGAVRGIAAWSDNITGYLAGGTTGSTVAATSASYATWNGSAFSSGTSMPSERAFGALVLSATKSFYIGGFDNTGTAVRTIYTLSSGTWTSANMTVSGTDYYLARPAAAIVNGSVYIFGGSDGSTVNSTVLILDAATGNLTRDTSGPTYGWTGRQAAQIAVFGSKIYIFGGTSSTNALDTGSVLSDLWVYDTSQAVGSRWSCRSGEVINAYARSRSGFAYDTTAGTLFIAGGLTTYARYTADTLSIPLSQASDCSGTPGLYVATGATVKLFEGGSRMNDWTWQGRQEVGPIPGPKMTWTRARLSAVSAVKVGVSAIDIAGTYGKDNYATTASNTTLGSRVRFWFPRSDAGSGIPQGQRLSLKLGANTSTTAAVYRVEIDAMMDSDG